MFYKVEYQKRAHQEIEKIFRVLLPEQGLTVREEQIRKEEQEKAEKVKAAAIEPLPDISDDDLPFEQPTTVTAYYRVVATPDELEAVEMAFNSIGVYFERRES